MNYVWISVTFLKIYLHIIEWRYTASVFGNVLDTYFIFNYSKDICSVSFIIWAKMFIILVDASCTIFSKMKRKSMTLSTLDLNRTYMLLTFSIFVLFHFFLHSIAKEWHWNDENKNQSITKTATTEHLHRTLSNGLITIMTPKHFIYKPNELKHIFWNWWFIIALTNVNEKNEKQSTKDQSVHAFTSCFDSVFLFWFSWHALCGRILWMRNVVNANVSFHITNAEPHLSHVKQTNKCSLYVWSIQWSFVESIGSIALDEFIWKIKTFFYHQKKSNNPFANVSVEHYCMVMIQ